MKRIILLFFVLILTFILNNTKADYFFGEPENLGPPVNTSYSDQCPSITTDGLELYFTSSRSGSYSSRDIWVARRSRTDDPWGEPVNLGPTVNSSSPQWVGCISYDGLSLYFNSTRSGGYGGSWGDIWVTKRATKDDAWGPPMNLGPMVNSSYNDIAPCISADGLSLLFASNRIGGSGNTDIWITTRGTTNDPWTEPTNLGVIVNCSAHDICGYISFDGRMLVLNDYEMGPFRPGGYGGCDLWITTRASVSNPWSTPINLGSSLNSSYIDGQPAISADGSIIIFMSNRAGGLGSHDLWQAPIIPVVDFNADGIVDAADMCIMVDYWGTDEPLCDIGPMPWGDGIVDGQDLIVLAGHLFEKANDPTLIACWAFDETEGMLAVDSTGDNDAVVLGGIEWQPTGGQVDGALKLDGDSGYAVTGTVLNPADGPFSVIAWVKGGVPGQAVLSQTGAANWLCTDSVEGYLITELKRDSGRFEGDSLSSEACINDGNWHRIGFVWDGLCRHLYIDGVEVAKDAEPLSGLNDAYGGLYIGCGKGMESGTFFSGLIDDVRIYNRAVRP